MKTTRLSSSTLTLILLVAAPATRVLGAPGELDPTFGANGIAYIQFPRAAFSGGAGGIFAQADGRMLLGRVYTSDAVDFSVIRLNADGTLDSSFGGEGRSLFVMVGFTGRTSAVLQLADGKIAVAGTAEPSGSATRQLALARFLGDGRVDTAFGAQGVARLEHAAVDGTVSVVEQGDGKLVAAGVGLVPGCAGCWDYGADVRASNPAGSDTRAILLVRFDTAGLLDAGFGSSGQVIIDPSGGVGSGIRWLAQGPGATLVAAGFSGRDMAVVRLTGDGLLDPTFDGDGIVTLHVGPAEATSVAEAVVVQSDGKIVVAGTVDPACGGNACDSTTDVGVARLNGDGSLDTSFGLGGIVTFDVAGADRTTASTGSLVVEPGGALVIGGEAGELGERYGFLTRLAENGSLDPLFGDEGVTLIDVGRFGNRSDAEMRGISRFPDGRIAAALSGLMNSRGDARLIAARTAPSGGSPGVIGIVDTDLAASEGSSVVAVVRRTGGATGEVSVDYRALCTCWDSPAPADDSDYVDAAGTLRWADGDTADRTITIPFVSDPIFEDDEDFILTLSTPSGGATFAAEYAWVVIVDVNDNPGVLRFVSPSVTAREGDGQVWLFVSRADGRTGEASVSYTTSARTATAGNDFGVVSGTLHWDDGDRSMKRISVPILGDGVDDDGETFEVTLSDATGATLDAATATVMIQNLAPEQDGGGGSVSLLDVVLLAVLSFAALGATSRKRGARRDPPRVVDRSSRSRSLRTDQ